LFGFRISPPSKRLESCMTARSLKAVKIVGETRAGAEFGAGLYFYRKIDAQRIADIQTDGFAPGY
jgi:hypothetical protein